MMLYIVPAIGVNVSAHFCGSELMAVSHKMSAMEKCFCGSQKMKKGCCEDKEQTFKMDDSQQKAELFSQSFANPFYLLPAVTEIFPIPGIFETAFQKETTLFPPPPLFKRPIYLLNRVFRI